MSLACLVFPRKERQEKNQQKREEKEKITYHFSDGHFLAIFEKVLGAGFFVFAKIHYYVMEILNTFFCRFLTKSHS